MNIPCVCNNKWLQSLKISVLPEIVYQLGCNDKKKTIQYPFFHFDDDIRCADTIQHRIKIMITETPASPRYRRIYKISFEGVNNIFGKKLDNDVIRE